MADIDFDDSLQSRVLFLNRQAEGCSKEQQFVLAKDVLYSAHRLLDDAPPGPDRSALLATTLHNLGVLHTRTREFAKAVAYLEAACRLESSLGRDSAVSYLNLATARVPTGEMTLAKDAALHAHSIAESQRQLDVAALALIQVAKIEEDLAMRKPRDSERADGCQRCLERFHAAVATANRPPINADVAQQALAEMKAARHRMQLSGILKLLATPKPPQPPPKQAAAPPHLPPIKSTTKRPLGLYATQTARDVKNSIVSKSQNTPHHAPPPLPPLTARRPQQPAPAASASTTALPAIAKHQPHEPAKATAKATTKRQQLVTPVLFTCPSLYGLQALLAVTEAKRKACPGIKAVYGFLRDAEPLMPRFAIKTKGPPRDKPKKVEVAHRDFPPAVLLAVTLIMNRNAADVLRPYFKLWMKCIPQFRRAKPLRRAAWHLATRSAAVHLALRFMPWMQHARAALGKRVPIAPAQPNRSRRSSKIREAAESHLEKLMFKWISKMTDVILKIEEDREKFDDYTVADQVKALDQMKVEFASALSTCFHKHNGEPIADVEKLHGKLEPFMQMLLNDSEEHDETITLLNSMFHNAPAAGIKDILTAPAGSLILNLVEDGAFRYLECILDNLGEDPLPNWLEVLTAGMYDDSICMPFVEIVVQHPHSFPFAKAPKEMAPHWQQFAEKICELGPAADPDRGRLIEKLHQHDAIEVNWSREGDDECDVLCRAIKVDDVALAACLVKLTPKIDLDRRLLTGMCALVHAVLSDSPEMVRLLLDAGASRRVLYNGMTPLQIAKKLNMKPEIIELLTQAELNDPATAAIRKSFMVSPENSPGHDDGPAVEAFDAEELGLSPAVGAAPQNHADQPLDASFSSADTDQVECHLRKDAIAQLRETHNFNDLEVGSSDAPRRRVQLVNGKVVVTDRVGDAQSKVVITVDANTGHVFLDVGGHVLVAADVVFGTEMDGQADDEKPLRIELVALDNGNVALALADFGMQLLEPDLTVDASPLQAVSDDAATNFSEFALLTRAKGEDDQIWLDAMKAAAKRETSSAKERRRLEKQRNARLQIIRNFLGQEYHERAYHLGCVDVESLLLTYDSMQSPNLVVCDLDEPMVQWWTFDTNDYGHVVISLHGANHLCIGVTDEGDVTLAPRGAEPPLWELVELADGHMALELASKAGFLVEARLDQDRKTLVLTPDDQTSSFCEFVVRGSIGRDVDVMDTNLAVKAEATVAMSEDEAATRIQCLQRRRQAMKEVQTRREARATAGPAVPAQAEGEDARADEAATKIQALHRGRMARQRVDAIREHKSTVNAAHRYPLLSSLVAEFGGETRLVSTLLLLGQASAESASTTQGGHQDEVHQNQGIRRNSAAPRLTEDAAAMKIQALQRGRTARQEAERRRGQSSRATAAQRATASTAPVPRWGLLRALAETFSMSKLSMALRSCSGSATTTPQQQRAFSEDVAATKIQALQRGRGARQEVARKRTALGPTVVAPARATAPCEPPTAAPTLSDDAAATKIQALQRGRGARQEVARKRSGVASRSRLLDQLVAEFSMPTLRSILVSSSALSPREPHPESEQCEPRDEAQSRGEVTNVNRCGSVLVGLTQHFAMPNVAALLAGVSAQRHTRRETMVVRVAVAAPVSVAAPRPPVTTNVNRCGSVLVGLTQHFAMPYVAALLAATQSTELPRPPVPQHSPDASLPRVGRYPCLQLVASVHPTFVLRGIVSSTVNDDAVTLENQESASGTYGDAFPSNAVAASSAQEALGYLAAVTDVATYCAIGTLLNCAGIAPRGNGTATLRLQRWGRSLMARQRLRDRQRARDEDLERRIVNECQL